jgi:hypothetical protein
MTHYLIVLDRIEAQSQVSEFLAGVQDRDSEARFVLLVPQTAEVTPQDSWFDAAEVACHSLETLRDAGLSIQEAIVSESREYAVERELARPDRSYDCVLRFTQFRRGIHVQRITLASQRARGRLTASAPMEAAG